MTEPTIDMEATLKWLDHGDLKKLAASNFITYRQARNIIKGTSKNFNFLEIVIQKAEENMRLAERTQILRNNLYLIK